MSTGTKADARRRAALKRVRADAFLARLMSPVRVPANREERRAQENDHRRLLSSLRAKVREITKKRECRAAKKRRSA